MICVGLRRETKLERRTPLTPEHIKKLLESGDIHTVVQPSENRIFTDNQYRAAGAEIKESLSECQAIFGVKEVPVSELLNDKTYLFFSHTIKGQSHNMGMLKKAMDGRNTLIDYELIKTDHGRRAVFLSSYAGYAGMINGLWTFGKRLTSEGIENPFTELEQTREYESLTKAEEAVQEAGKMICAEGLPPEITPLIIGFTGFGSVSKAAQKIATLLPHKQIAPNELNNFVNSKKYTNKEVYLVEYTLEDLYERKDGGAFSEEHYFNNPKEYQNKLNKTISNLNILVNGIYWENKYPRLITKEGIVKYTGNPKVIADISCDINGSIELTEKATKSENPVYVYNTSTGEIMDGVIGNGPVILAQDALPSELAREASQAFGDALLPFIALIARTNFKEQSDNEILTLPKEITDAIILRNGKLTEKFEYLKEFVKQKN